MNTKDKRMRRRQSCTRKEGRNDPTLPHGGRERDGRREEDRGERRTRLERTKQSDTITLWQRESEGERRERDKILAK